MSTRRSTWVCRHIIFPSTLQMTFSSVARWPRLSLHVPQRRNISSSNSFPSLFSPLSMALYSTRKCAPRRLSSNLQYRQYSPSRTAGFSESSNNNDDDVDHHDYQIRMPQINEATEGVVDQWLKKVGDSFVNGERLCIVSLGDLTVAVDAIRDGVISEILLPAGQKGSVSKPIAIFVQNQKEYLAFLEDERQESLEAEKMAEAKSVESAPEKGKVADSKDLMRAVRHLIQTGKLDGDSEIAKKMQGLARKGNTELLSIFEASTDGPYNPDTFDYKFFMENATDVVKELKDS